MRNILSFNVIVVLAAGAIFCSCNNQKRSEKTGIKYDKKKGGFQTFKANHPAPGPGLVAIEGGTFVEGGSAEQSATFDYIDKQRRSIASFYMDETEVSNRNWLEYLNWIAVRFPADRELYYNALPDTLVWRRPLSANEPYVNSYFRHAAFMDYPVVGVTWDQANDFCDWRTHAVNENLLIETGHLQKPKKDGTNPADGTTPAPAAAASAPPTAFNTEVYLNGQDTANSKKGPNGKAKPPVRAEDGILKAHYRLPSEAEWEYAALGIVSKDENIKDGRMYPWDGMGVRSAKRQTQGLILANFKRGMGDYAGVAGSLNDKALVTAPVRSFLPNDFGLFNMAGNVNEWTSSTFRQLRDDESDLNPYRGNEFVNTRMSDPQKGIIAKDRYGKPIYDPATSDRKLPWAELSKASHTNVPEPTTPNSKPGTVTASLEGKAYNPDQRGYNDTVNTILYGHTTLINDRSKVYKGGSWNDMAYWLNPATRRYMDQGEASADVGFRCAMDLDGASEIHPENRTHLRVKNPPKYTPK